MVNSPMNLLDVTFCLLVQEPEKGQIRANIPKPSPMERTDSLEVSCLESSRSFFFLNTIFSLGESLGDLLLLADVDEGGLSDEVFESFVTKGSFELSDGGEVGLESFSDR